MNTEYTEEMEYEAYVDMCQRLSLSPVLSFEEYIRAISPSLVEDPEGS